ncbi:hypothetical protein KW791_01170 [Candidatus Parcubacteria bacterium]|nr:hypothetical protein [Candidatus Parcubacteria bacterium]
MDNTKNTPRDTFLYLLSVITLIISAVAFGILVYQFVDLRFPDALNGGYYYPISAAKNTIRQSLAALIVVFPVFVWISWFLRRDVERNAEKKELKIRKWLLYFTVFVASLIIIGDLVALIYSFLNGELTARFIFKVLTILFIAASSLFYYLAELRDTSYPRRIFQGVVFGVVAVALVFGFYKAGLPQNQRLQNFDDRKISDLSSIQYQIVNYWQRKQQMPPRIEDLNDPISSYMVPVDPQTNQPYEYHPVGPKSFQLCASFNYANKDQGNGSIPMGANWAHEQGRSCFDRNIDQDLYPPVKSMPIPF